MPQVLVLDGRQRSALAATRSLGGRGLGVLVADIEPATLAGSSRYAYRSLVYPDPLTEPDRFVAWVMETARVNEIDAVLPLTDVTTMELVARSADLCLPRLLCAPRHAYELASDKARLFELAERIGVAIPATRRVDTLDELQHELAGRTFPVVLKPARSKVRIDGRIMSTAVLIAHAPEQALEYAKQQRWLGTIPCLIQDYVEGHGAGIFAFYDRGEPHAWFSHRRIREKPPSGGVSVLSESAPIDTRLQLAAKRILDAVQWDGAAMVEFRVAADGTPYLMEINARLWGSLQLAIDSGVDFPWLLYQRAMGAALPAPGAYRTGARLRWLLGDLDNLLIQLRDSRLSGSARLGAASKFVATCFDLGCRQEILRWSDPRPAAHELRTWLGALR